MIKNSILVFCILLTAHLEGFGQCCAAGNPAGGDGTQGGISKNEIRVHVFYRHSLSRDYFHFAKKTEVPYIEKSYYDFNNISLTYGLFQRLAIHTELGYFVDKAQNLNINNEKEKIQSHGLGDLTINLRYKAIETVRPLAQMIFSGGIKLPVGAFSEEQDGIYIPVSLQPSSGALKYNASWSYSRKRQGGKIGWNSLLIFEVSSKIEKDFLIYKYGNYLQFAWGGFYSLSKSLTMVTNLKYELRGHDRRENNISIESTGSSVILLNPYMQYSIKNNWSFILLGELPVYKYVNGYQLTNRYAWQFGIKKDFKPCSK